MKYSAKFITFVMALSTSAMVPPASGQTQPANPGAPQLRCNLTNRCNLHNRRKSNRRRNLSLNRTPTVGLRVRQLVPQSEPLRGTQQGARSLELGIPVASRGGPTGGSNIETTGRAALITELQSIGLTQASRALTFRDQPLAR
jgi:hypothetical protein